MISFWLASCAPVPAAGAQAGSLELAVRALNSGDMDALRTSLGHDKSHSTWADELARRLDPAAWRIVLGAQGREFDPGRSAGALSAGDTEAVLIAVGFSEQALRADVLDAGRTVYMRRARGLDYTETSPAPVSAVNELLVPPLAEGLLAYELHWFGRLDSRAIRVRAGRNSRGLSNLQAAVELARSGPAAPPDDSRASLSVALSGLALADPGPNWWGVDAWIVDSLGEIRVVTAGRDERGWYVISDARTTLYERLEAERDRRLEVVRRMAADRERSSGAWPRQLSDITVRAADLVDPAAPAGRLGWAELAVNPAPTLRLLQPAGVEDAAVACTERAPKGLRAITRDGRLVWLEP